MGPFLLCLPSRRSADPVSVPAWWYGRDDETDRQLTDHKGFTDDIGAEPDDLNLAVSLFFTTFILFQLPSAAIGRWLGAKQWIPIMTVGYIFYTGLGPNHGDQNFGY
jgi:hypothetical protein